MVVVKESSLKVLELPVEQIKPNGWNVNRVPPEIFAKLREYVRKIGFLEPIVVRPVNAGHYEIVGGEHRWRIAKELGYESVPAAIIELDDRQARIASLNLNEMHGGFVPSLFGRAASRAHARHVARGPRECAALGCVAAGGL